MNRAESTRRRNTFDLILSEEPVERFCQCSPPENFPRARRQRIGDGVQVFGSVSAEIRALWGVSAGQTVGVLVAAASQRTLTVKERDLETRIDPSLCMFDYLGTVTGKEC